MGKYSPEPDVTLAKREVAVRQLETAISLFLSRDFLAAITLAGAAEEIFSVMLGRERPTERTWKDIEEVRRQAGLPYAGSRSKGEAMKEWNNAKNRLKHQNDGEGPLTINLFDESYQMIQRANAAGDALAIRAQNRDDYENWLMVNIYIG